MKPKYIYLIFTLGLFSCISHSKLLDNPDVPMLCKYALECMAYNEKNPTACSSEKDLCSWKSRKDDCQKDANNPDNLEKGRLTRHEVLLDCLSRTK